MTDHVLVYRPTPKPSVNQPFGVRSAGRYRTPDPQVFETLPGRPFTQIYWIKAGRVGFHLGQTDTVCSAGEVYLYDENIPHQVRTLDPASEYLWLTIDGSLGQASIAAFGLRPPWPHRAGPVPERLFERLFELLPDPAQTTERTASAIGWEILSAAASADAGPEQADPVVERLRRQLVERAGDPLLSVAILASELGIDRSVLTRRFTRATGMAPKPFLQSLRLSRAMSLLHVTDSPIAVIARDCGFSDPGYFARVFRAHTGSTPEGFRRS